MGTEPRGEHGIYKYLQAATGCHTSAPTENRGSEIDIRNDTLLQVIAMTWLFFSFGPDVLLASSAGPEISGPATFAVPSFVPLAKGDAVRFSEPQGVGFDYSVLLFGLSRESGNPGLGFAIALGRYISRSACLPKRQRRQA